MYEYFLISSNKEKNYLTHYGVKGMKWGRRKANYKTVKGGSWDTFSKNKDFRNSAKKLNAQSKVVNEAYSKYLKALRTKNAKKELDIAKTNHKKEAYKLRQQASKEAKNLLGRYGKKRVSDLYAIDYVSGKMVKGNTANNVLSQFLANYSLENTTTSKQKKVYKNTIENDFAKNTKKNMKK